MKKTAERSSNSRWHVICPFCGYEPTWFTEMTWCAKCYTEFTVTNGKVVFDDKLKTPKFAWAKALAKAGGIKMTKAIDDYDKHR